MRTTLLTKGTIMEIFYAFLLFVALIFAMATAVTYKLAKTTKNGIRRLVRK